MVTRARFFLLLSAISFSIVIFSCAFRRSMKAALSSSLIRAEVRAWSYRELSRRLVADLMSYIVFMLSKTSCFPLTPYESEALLLTESVAFRSLSRVDSSSAIDCMPLNFTFSRSLRLSLLETSMPRDALIWGR